MDLGFSTTTDNGVVVVAVSGEVDVYTAPVLRDALDQQILAVDDDLVVDLEGVDFMDSTGLGVLVGRLKLSRGRGHTIRLVCTRERILSVFGITGLDKVFEIYGDRPQAVAATRPTGDLS